MVITIYYCGPFCTMSFPDNFMYWFFQLYEQNDPLLYRYVKHAQVDYAKARTEQRDHPEPIVLRLRQANTLWDNYVKPNNALRARILKDYRLLRDALASKKDGAA